MKLFLLKDTSKGSFNVALAEAELILAANQLGLEMVSRLTEAEYVIVIGGTVPAVKTLTGKRVICTEAETIFSNPSAALQTLINNAIIWEEDSITKLVSLDKTPIRFVGVTACPTGVAHTFMAAEALVEEAKKRGWQARIETRGSVGAGNELSKSEIEAADFVIVAADIEVDLSKFAGKKIYRTKTGSALKKTAQELDKALELAKPYLPEKEQTTTLNTKEKQEVYKHLLTGISYMLPMVVAGGLIVALSFAFGGIQQEGVLAQALKQIGGDTALALMVPLLSGFIAYSIADRPGIVPGLIGGVLAININAGFLGGIASGYLAGYVVYLLTKYIRLPKSFEALKPILILPLVASLATGLTIIFVIGQPIAYLMTALTTWLSTIQTGNAIILGAILGGMMCTDMGGPVNKVAYAFGVGLLSAQYYQPMAAIMAGGMVPPLAMSLATVLAPKKFSQNERDSGKAAFVLGLCFISEGAIPFAARDPIRVVPCCMLGGALTGALTFAYGSTLMAPHGGLFVLAIPGAIHPVVGYLISIVSGSVLSGVLYAIIKKASTDTAAEVIMQTGTD